MAFEDDSKHRDGEENPKNEKFEINWDTVWKRDEMQKAEERQSLQAEELSRLEAERALLEAERLRLSEERTRIRQSKKELEKAELERAKERYRRQVQKKGGGGEPIGQTPSPERNAGAYGGPFAFSGGTGESPRTPKRPKDSPQPRAQAVGRRADEPPKKAAAPKKKKKWRTLAATAATLAVLYCVAVFSNIPFIEKWRTIYIETAMSTLSHHWLATAFIPRSVINKAMSGSNLDLLQDGMSSNWSIGGLPVGEVSRPWVKAEKKFFKVFPEIEKESFKNYLASAGDEVYDDKGYLMIDKAGLDQNGTDIRTTAGDRVLAIDTENAISIIKVEGEGYVGKLAIIKDPAQMFLGLSPGFDDAGAFLGDIARAHNAVLAINASGFADPAGHGDGSNAYGMVISEGKLYKKPVGESYKMIAFDNGHKLNIGEFSDTGNFRDGVEFKPALVLNGEKVVSGSAGWGIAPRSVIGQTKDGQVLLLIIDGRAPGYSIGNTMEECADIMLRYGAMQASNLDGGSSSLMFYRGREITKPSAANREIGRHIPNGFMVAGRK